MNREAFRGSDDDPPQEGFTLPQRYFTAESIFRREQERLFWRHWFCVGRRDWLQVPGDYFLADVAGQSLICTLTADEALRAFYNTCRHRGTQLAAEERGRFSGCRILCPYHRWTYSCSGELVSAPCTDEEPAFRLQDLPLVSVAIAEWQGFLLVNLGENPIPLDDAYAGFYDRLNPWQATRLRVVHREDYELTTNWKLILQNFNECYHCPSVHPGLTGLSPPASAQNDFTEGLLLGGPMDLTKGSMTMTGQRCCPAIETLAPSDLERTYYYTLFPNLMLGLHPEFVVAWTLHPRAPDRTRVVCQWLFQPESLAASNFDPSGAVEFWQLTNQQDWMICERSYAGITSRGYRPGPYLHNENVVRTLDRQILAALRHDE